MEAGKAGALTLLAILLVSAWAGNGPLSAHHGVVAIYDLTGTPVTLQGTVTEFSWRNPHVTTVIEVKDAAGRVVTWRLEHDNTYALGQLGYNGTTLRAGQRVTVVVHPARSGAPAGLAARIILDDGREILVRNAADPSPRRE